jgi:hypothetical protein
LHIHLFTSCAGRNVRGSSRAERCSFFFLLQHRVGPRQRDRTDVVIISIFRIEQ